MTADVHSDETQPIKPAPKPKTNGKDHDVPMFDTATPTRNATCEDVRHILALHRRLYAFGGVLVEVAYSPAAGLFVDTEKTTPAKFPRPVIITKDRAVGHIEKVCGWQAEVSTKTFKGFVRRPVPEWAARLIAGGSSEHFPPLAGVIRHPVLDANNELKAGRLGYDLKSQYFIDAPITDLSGFTWQSPEMALEWLVDEWLGEFCWNSRPDALRAVMLCLTMLKARTTLARHGKFPGFLVTAPMASTGKTELVECLTRAVCGEGIPFAAYPGDDEPEMNKLLMSIVMSDPSAFCFDNIQNGHSIRSAVLDQFITRDTFGGRLLGTNNIGEFPALSVVIATGNNIEAAEDSASRFLEIRLQPRSDRPQNTVFMHDAKNWTVELRPKILSALREIARHKHDIIQQRGRFPAWFREVAGPIMAISGDHTLLDAWDIAGSTIRNADAFEDFVARLADVHEATGINPLSAAEVITHAFREYAALVGKAVKPEYYAAITAEPADVVGTETEKAPITVANLKLAKAAEAARRTVASGVTASLKTWRDQMAGGLRLRFVDEKDRNRKMRTHFSVVERRRPGPPAEEMEF